MATSTQFITRVDWVSGMSSIKRLAEIPKWQLASGFCFRATKVAEVPRKILQTQLATAPTQPPV